MHDDPIRLTRRDAIAGAAALIAAAPRTARAQGGTIAQGTVFEDKDQTGRPSQPAHPRRDGVQRHRGGED
jgi:SLT domain-containing protein